MTEIPSRWRRLAVHAVGGLTEVGFTPDERYLLVVSHSGRGLIDLEGGQRVARDPERRWDSGWLDETLRMADAIGPAAGVRVPVAGLWGGRLASESPDGSTILVEQGRGGESGSVTLVEPGGASSWVLDRPITEVRAAGFCASGACLVIATASDVALFVRS